MVIDPQLRIRILRTLRWIIPTVQYNNSTKNDERLPEAIALLREIEQGEMLLGDITKRHEYSEDECRDVGFVLGMTPTEITEFFLHYAKQGWLQGNGLPLVDLRCAMRAWHLRNNKGEAVEPVRNGKGKTPREMDIELRGR